MRNWISFVIFPAVVACGSGVSTGNSQVADTDTLSRREQTEILAAEDAATGVKEEVEARITAIYEEVFGCYLAHVDDYCECDFDTPEILSQDFFALSQKVLHHDSELGEIGFKDSDHWVQGQDWNIDLAMKLMRTDVVSDSTAHCHIVIQNCGSKTPLTVVMVKERGCWFIDDFISDFIDDSSAAPTRLSEKTLMQNYLAETDSFEIAKTIEN